MKERNLAGHKKYSNQRYFRIKNSYREVYVNGIENDPKYWTRYLDSEKHILESKKYKGRIEYDEYNKNYVYFLDEESLNEFFKDRDNIHVPLYEFLMSLLEEAELRNDKKFNSLNILSASDRYIQKKEITPTYDLEYNVFMIFKMVSVYRLHCYCSYKLLEHGIVILLIHSPYQTTRLTKMNYENKVTKRRKEKANRKNNKKGNKKNVSG